MRMKVRVLLGGVAAGAMYAALTSAAFAQGAPSPVNPAAPPAPGDDATTKTAPVTPSAKAAIATNATAGATGTVEEVVVTARRVTESMQSVPIPVTAFSGKQLEEARVFTPEALTNQVPNFKVFRGAGNSNTYAYYIRGIGRDIGYFYAESPVSLYVDDVFYPYQAGPVLGIGGIDHVEVLRGPQGTLYGKNATVGTVKIYNKRPDPNGEDREMALTVGSYGRFEAQLSENMPIIEGKLAFRADVGMKYYDGYLKDIVSNDTLGGINTHGGRFALTWTPDDVTDVYLAVDGQTSRDEIVPWTPILYNADKTEVFPRYGDRYVTATYMPHVNDLDTAGVTLQARRNFGDLQLRSISSYRGFSQEFANDNGASVNNPISWNDIITHDNSWSQEFVGSGSALDGKLTYVGGVFYFSSTTSMRFIQGSNATQHTKQHSTSAAVYVDGSYEILPRLRLSAGVRYTRDDKDARQESWSSAGAKIVDENVNDSWNATTPKVGIDYQLNDNILLFATWGKGYKGGGLSTGQPTVPAQVLFIPPEFSENTEVGVKSEWFDHRLRVNLNYFDTDYTNMIQTLLNLQTGTSSVAYADAKVKGFEFDIVGKPLPQWTISVKGSTLDAKNVNVEPGFPAYNWDDKSLKHAPKLTYNIATDYVLDVMGGELTLTAQYQWFDKMYESLARDISTESWAHDIIDLRASYVFPNDQYSVVLDATNVGDENYFVLGSTKLARQYGPPPEVSLTFRYRM